MRHVGFKLRCSGGNEAAMALSKEQRLLFLIWTPVAVAPLSVLGSSLTMLCIFRTKKAGAPIKTYHRLLLGISIFDLVLSTGIGLGPLPIPKEDFPVQGAHGTRATCTFQALLMQVGTGSFVYSAMLMLYYVLMIRFGLKEETISRKVEPFMHIIPIGYHIGTGILGLVWEVYNPAGLHCWVAPYPQGCHEDPKMECERGGDHVELFGLWLLTIPILIWTCLLCLFLLVVAMTVWWRYRLGRRFLFESKDRQEQHSPSNKMDARTRLVITQCVLYAVCYINVTVWSTISTIVDLHGVDEEFYEKHVWIDALGVFFFPIQGLFSFLIYLRPRYLTIRREVGNGLKPSWWFALKEAVLYPVDTASERMRRRHKISQSSCSTNLKQKIPEERLSISSFDLHAIQPKAEEDPREDSTGCTFPESGV